jgi:hypothetical protein
MKRRGPERSEDTRRPAERIEALDQLEPDSAICALALSRSAAGLRDHVLAAR